MREWTFVLAVASGVFAGLVGFVVGVNGGVPWWLPVVGIPAVVLFVPRITFGQRLAAYALGVGVSTAVAFFGAAGYSS